MEKEVREFDVPYTLYWTHGVKISKIRSDLDEIEKLGATRIDIEADTFSEGSVVNISVVSERLETDEEFKFRVAEEKKNVVIRRLNELEQLKRLKAKYEK